MSETTVGKLNVSIGITVDYSTVETCLRLLEIYLDSHDSEKLVILSDKPGYWRIDIDDRGERK